jgi:hypothetical protein
MVVGEQLGPCGIAQSRSAFGRGHDVGEQDRGEPALTGRLGSGVAATRNQEPNGLFERGNVPVRVGGLDIADHEGGPLKTSRGAHEDDPIVRGNRSLERDRAVDFAGYTVLSAQVHDRGPGGHRRHGVENRRVDSVVMEGEPP